MRHWLPILTLTAVVSAGTAGCGLTCKEVQSRLEEAKQTELADANGKNGDDETAPQFALGVRTDTLETVAADVVSEAITSVLSVSSELDVAGKQPIGVRALPTIKSFSLDRREEACAHCFQMSADLDGNAKIDIPVLGQRTVPMTGKLQFVAPITVGPGDDNKTTAIELDLAEAARQNAPILALELTDLRKAWRKTIESLLSSKLGDTLTEKLEPVTLATFKTPDFGLPSLGMQPVGLRITPDGSVVQALMATDIPMPSPPTARALGRAAVPTDDHNLALALPTGLVPAGVAYGFRSGNISRTYTGDGEASDSAPFHVTVRDFSVASAGKADDDNQAYDFEFRAYRLSESGPCYWLDGRASGAMEATNSSVQVSIDDVSFTESSATDITVAAANWMSAEFLKSGAKIVGGSLDGENLSMPGGVYGVTQMALNVSDGFLTVSGVATEQQEGGN